MSKLASSPYTKPLVCRDFHLPLLCTHLLDSICRWVHQGTQSEVTSQTPAHRICDSSPSTNYLQSQTHRASDQLPETLIGWRQSVFFSIFSAVRNNDYKLNQLKATNCGWHHSNLANYSVDPNKQCSFTETNWYLTSLKLKTTLDGSSRNFRFESEPQHWLIHKSAPHATVICIKYRQQMGYVLFSSNSKQNTKFILHFMLKCLNTI